MKKIVLAAVLCVGLLQAEEVKKGVEALSPEVRGLLSQEMLHIEKGMQQIFSNIVKGEYETIAKTAEDIQNSFILKKKLTDGQKAELKAHIPKSFFKTDFAFHELAGKLSMAAEYGDKETVQQYFSEMTQACVKCHSTYATQRFPVFTEE